MTTVAPAKMLVTRSKITIPAREKGTLSRMMAGTRELYDQDHDSVEQREGEHQRRAAAGLAHQLGLAARTTAGVVDPDGPHGWTPDGGVS